jgi:hypothetical protein
VVRRRMPSDGVWEERNSEEGSRLLPAVSEKSTKHTAGASTVHAENRLWAEPGGNPRAVIAEKNKLKTKANQNKPTAVANEKKPTAR